ncbi:MAG: ABC transporter permease subunit [Coriobacteriia bacterium]|nr:ABC transporter permease subunit [Coriobacteriia bacterium]MBS5477427.1 ABC transporter permease subunit [Coriobacteriia bacterium]
MGQHIFLPQVFIRELRANARSLVVWSLVMAFFMAVGTVKYSGAEGGGAQMGELIAQFPRIVLAVFGMGDAADVDIASFPGFYTVLWFYAALIMAASSVSFGRSAVTREIADGTCEFLFVRPAARAAVLAAKLCAALVCVAVLAGVGWLASAATYPTLGLDADESALFVRATLALLCLGAVFGSLGAACAAVIPQVERGALAGSCLVLVAYLAAVGHQMFAGESWAVVLRVLSPLRWLLPDQLAQGGIDLGFAVLAGFVVLAGGALAFSAFSRRDLATR